MIGRFRMAFAALFFALLCLASMPHASDFSLRSLNVFISANLDGSANVEERIDLLINGSMARELYDNTRGSYSDLTTWKNRTQVSEIRHHVTRAKADVSDLRITPQAIERCSPFMGYCYATLVISYKINAGANGSALITIDKYKPRTTLYSLDPEVLSFEQTKTGDLILPAGTVISILIPQQAKKIFFSAPPANLQEAPQADFFYDQAANSTRHYVGKERSFSWQGDTLPKFVFTYEIESPLETEVMEFFRGSQGTILSFLLGPQGLAALALFLIAAISLLYLNRINRR